MSWLVDLLLKTAWLDIFYEVKWIHDHVQYCFPLFFRHNNVVLFMGCVSKKILAIVTQWCEASSLHRHIHVDESKFELNNTIAIATQTSLGME